MSTQPETRTYRIPYVVTVTTTGRSLGFAVHEPGLALLFGLVLYAML